MNATCPRTGEREGTVDRSRRVAMTRCPRGRGEVAWISQRRQGRTGSGGGYACGGSDCGGMLGV
ncbi:hypothetical protein GCM10022286_13950 [Gryllotalpicola daejeonensis]|uniref:Uncharacterized protein n=1 Tax=Gryllotalpicola daejeonensis TaxID=993087 RepID=A0ABP7ZIZ5_9MICO